MKQVLVLTEIGYEILSVDWDEMLGVEVLESLYNLIECERIETVTIAENIVLVVDEEGLFNSSFHRYIQYGELETMAYGNIVVASTKNDSLSGFTNDEMNHLLDNLKVSNSINE